MDDAELDRLFQLVGGHQAASRIDADRHRHRGQVRASELPDGVAVDRPVRVPPSVALDLEILPRAHEGVLDLEDDIRAEGGKAHGVRRVLVPSTASNPVSLGLLYEPTPITPAPSGTILDGGTL